MARLALTASSTRAQAAAGPVGRHAAVDRRPAGRRSRSCASVSRSTPPASGSAASPAGRITRMAVGRSDDLALLDSDTKSIIWPTAPARRWRRSRRAAPATSGGAGRSRVRHVPAPLRARQDAGRRLCAERQARRRLHPRRAERVSIGHGVGARRRADSMFMTMRRSGLLSTNRVPLRARARAAIARGILGSCCSARRVRAGAGGSGRGASAVRRARYDQALPFLDRAIGARAAGRARSGQPHRAHCRVRDARPRPFRHRQPRRRRHRLRACSASSPASRWPKVSRRGSSRSSTRYHSRRSAPSS